MLSAFISGWRTPSPPAVIDESFELITLPEAEPSEQPSLLLYLQDLARRMSDVAIRRDMLHLAQLIAQLPPDILPAQLEDYVVKVMDAIHRSEAPTIVRWRAKLQNEPTVGDRQLFAIYTRSVEGDFEKIEEGEIAPTPTNYPIRALRSIALRISDVAKESELLGLTHHIAQLPDQELDAQFVALYYRFMSALFFSNETEVESARVTISSQNRVWAHFLERLITIHTEERGVANERETYEVVNCERYAAKAEEVALKTQAIEGLTQRLLTLCLNLQKTSVEPQRNQLLAQVQAIKDQLKKRTNELLLTQAHLDIFTSFLEQREKKQAISSRREFHSYGWGALGFMVTVLACRALLPPPLLGITLLTGLTGGNLSRLGAFVGNEMIDRLYARIGRDRALVPARSIFPAIEQEGDGLTSPLNQRTSALMTYRFDENTTGLTYFFGMGSETAGILILSPESVEKQLIFRFLLEDDHRMSKEDLYRMAGMLLKALDTKTITPQQCLKYLNILRQAKIKRPSLPDRPVIGFITHDEMLTIFHPVILRCLAE